MNFSSKSGKFNIMENKDTKAIDDNSGHVSKFFKLSPDSISKFNKEKNLVKKMNQDICEITEKITEKMVYTISKLVLISFVNLKMDGNLALTKKVNNLFCNRQK
jgi:hypothetical protein